MPTDKSSKKRRQEPEADQSAKAAKSSEPVVSLTFRDVVTKLATCEATLALKCKKGAVTAIYSKLIPSGVRSNLISWDAVYIMHMDPAVHNTRYTLAEWMNAIPTEVVAGQDQVVAKDVFWGKHGKLDDVAVSGHALLLMSTTAVGYFLSINSARIMFQGGFNPSSPDIDLFRTTWRKFIDAQDHAKYTELTQVPRYHELARLGVHITNYLTSDGHSEEIMAQIKGEEITKIESLKLVVDSFEQFQKKTKTIIEMARAGSLIEEIQAAVHLTDVKAFMRQSRYSEEYQSLVLTNHQNAPKKATASVAPPATKNVPNILTLLNDRQTITAKTDYKQWMEWLAIEINESDNSAEASEKMSRASKVQYAIYDIVHTIIVRDPHPKLPEEDQVLKEAFEKKLGGSLEQYPGIAALPLRTMCEHVFKDAVEMLIQQAKRFISEHRIEISGPEITPIMSPRIPAPAVLRTFVDKCLGSDFHEYHKTLTTSLVYQPEYRRTPAEILPFGTQIQFDEWKTMFQEARELPETAERACQKIVGMLTNWKKLVRVVWNQFGMYLSQLSMKKEDAAVWDPMIQAMREGIEKTHSELAQGATCLAHDMLFFLLKSIQHKEATDMQTYEAATKNYANFSVIVRDPDNYEPEQTLVVRHDKGQADVILVVDEPDEEEGTSYQLYRKVEELVRMVRKAEVPKPAEGGPTNLESLTTDDEEYEEPEDVQPEEGEGQEGTRQEGGEQTGRKRGKRGRKVDRTKEWFEQECVAPFEMLMGTLKHGDEFIYTDEDATALKQFAMYWFEKRSLSTKWVATMRKIDYARIAINGMRTVAKDMLKFYGDTFSDELTAVGGRMPKTNPGMVRTVADALVPLAIRWKNGEQVGGLPSGLDALASAAEAVEGQVDGNRPPTPTTPPSAETGAEMGAEGGRASATAGLWEDMDTTQD